MACSDQMTCEDRSEEVGVCRNGGGEPVDPPAGGEDGAGGDDGGAGGDQGGAGGAGGQG